MQPLERVLVDLDRPPWSAISRVALGLTILPAFRALTGNSDRIWLYLISFLGLLLVLRLVPAMLRHAMPFSSEAKAIWAGRRQIAKQHDSYQWQKLFWIGLGLLPYTVLGEVPQINEIVLTLFCLIGGTVGLLLWHRTTFQPARAKLLSLLFRRRDELSVETMRPQHCSTVNRGSASPRCG